MLIKYTIKLNICVHHTKNIFFLNSYIFLCNNILMKKVLYFIEILYF